MGFSEADPRLPAEREFQSGEEGEENPVLSAGKIKGKPLFCLIKHRQVCFFCFCVQTIGKIFLFPNQMPVRPVSSAERRSFPKGESR